ncbi:MAG: hypothetical protein RLZZ347_92 [Candidatus Parcubacteria bacterium]|jgi:hypothetical protein
MKKLNSVAILLAFLSLVSPCFGATNFVLTSVSDPVKTTFTVASSNVLLSSWNLQISTNGEPFADVVGTINFGSVDNKSVGFYVLHPTTYGFYRGKTVLSGTNAYSTTNLLFTTQTAVTQGGITISAVGPSLGYVLETSTNLVNWTFYSSNAPGVMNLALDPPSGPRKYYRVKVVLP